jgi:ketosteroid isomerase-like protein
MTAVAQARSAGGSRSSRAFVAAVVVGQVALALEGCASPPRQPGNAELTRQVADTERAFARSMAERNHDAFTSFLSEEAVFFTGPKPLHGKEQVANAWKRFYARPEAPFSWAPDEVEVLASGTLAITSGPVYGPNGKLIARFTTVWRQEAPGVWRVIFDRGNEQCDCPKPAQ